MSFHTIVEGITQDWDSAMNSQDFASAAALGTEDVEAHDHRSLGWPVIRGREALAEWYATMVSLAAEMRIHSTLIAARDDRAVVRQVATFRATPQDGGGEAEMTVFTLLTVREGKMIRIDTFDSEEAAGAALAEPA